MIEIPEEKYNELKKMGYSDEQIDVATKQLTQQQLDSAASSQTFYDDDLSQQSSFSAKVDENLIRWQLELNDILERAEHILRGDIPKYRDGNIIWSKNPNPDENPLNEVGIQEIMKILVMYINRNTILSDYNPDEINYKVLDFGRRLSNFVFMKYDEIGLNTENKRKHYEMIIGELVDMVHSAYKRALHGGERRSLREMINISQNQNMSDSNMMRERHILNPMRLIKGRYA